MVPPPIEVLRQLFDYDPLTGVLTWRVRSSEQFSHVRHHRMRARRYEGKPAGSLRPDGYVIVNPVIDGVTHRILAHRLIWALCHDRWPAAELDHVDGDCANNRLANLREASRSEQMQNMVWRVGRGVYADPRVGGPPFYARITVRRKVIRLGSFPTQAAAQAAYLKAKAELHSFQPAPR
jgi:hypothetical protein